MTVLGIDLGTTNSACYAWENGELINIPNRLGKKLTPSVVGLDDHEHMIVGETAKQRLITHSDKTVAVFKRLMGTDANVTIGSQTFSAPALSSFVLRSLKEDAEAFLKCEITDAVISVPAYFNENQRLATKQAGLLAGLNVNRLINEPTAAAMAYGLNDRQQGTFMILDMGGGTFDVSILEYFSGVMEVHASAGDNFLGGEDILDAMLANICEQLDVVPSSISTSDKQSILHQLEQFKCNTKSGVEETVAIVINDKSHNISLDNDWFVRVITPILLRIKQPIERSMADANLRASEIDEVILVGGSTRLQAFKQLVAQLFGRFPSANLDPDLVVAMGAGIQAGLIEKNEALDDIVLTDVCPYTLGTEVVNERGEPGYFFPIIERNTVVPVSIERPLTTVKDNQTELNIKVFQGENRLVKNNVYLGEVNAKIPRAKKGKEYVSVRYSYDMNGLLDIDVTVDSTGTKFSKTIENAPGMLNDEALQKAKEELAKIKFHPRESEEVRSILARSERVYQMLKGHERERLGQLMSEFDSVINDQNQIDIKKAIEQLNKILDQLESRSWF